MVLTKFINVVYGVNRIKAPVVFFELKTISLLFSTDLFQEQIQAYINKQNIGSFHRYQSVIN